RPIPEQYAHVTPVRTIVEARRMHFGAHQKHAAVLPRSDPRVSYREAVQETRALVPNVECRHARYAQLRLEIHAAAREEIVRTECRVNDAVDLRCVHLRPLERAARCCQRQVGAGLLSRLHPVPLLDTATLPDPF